MQMSKIAIAAVMATAVAGLGFVGSRTINAADSPGVALMGQVSSEKEGPMEGVLVSAKGEGSTITITVVSDDKGHYSFPAAKIGPGHYALKIRAIGYDLDGPKTADVSAGTAATADIKLRPTRSLAGQLSNAEWMMSMPGTDAQKRFLYDCAVCHTLERITRSTHDGAEFAQVIRRMGLYSQGSTPAHPQLQAGGAKRDPNAGGKLQATSEWLATTNLSASDTWTYAFKTLPRPKGRATRVVITEYDLPRKDAQPHDVIVDSKGIAWYSDFADQFMGKLDPKTGKATEYAIPVLKPGFPTGSLEAQFDKDENVWLSLMYQGGIAKFDRTTEKVQVFPLPKEVQRDHTQESMVMPNYAHVDGKVWTNNQDDHTILRMDIKTGAWEVLGPFPVPGVDRNFASYGMPADRDNNLYLLEYSADNIARIDAKTKEFKVYPTPTRGTQPRRGGFDAQGRLWFAEFGVGAIGMFDPKTEKTQEWKLPTPWSAPYQALADNKGEVWAASMLTDRVIRLEPKGGQVTEYLLPRETNVRRIFVDSSTTPVTFWVGNDHAASIVKVEPMD
jgi:streptogramin lyase